VREREAGDEPDQVAQARREQQQRQHEGKVIPAGQQVLDAERDVVEQGAAGSAAGVDGPVLGAELEHALDGLGLCSSRSGVLEAHEVPVTSAQQRAEAGVDVVLAVAGAAHGPAPGDPRLAGAGVVACAGHGRGERHARHAVCGDAQAALQ
jgi:hypothetical protein